LLAFIFFLRPALLVSIRCIRSVHNACCYRPKCFLLASHQHHTSTLALIFPYIYIYLFGSSGFSDHPSNCLRWPRLELEVEVYGLHQSFLFILCALACVQQQREGFCFVVFYFVFSFEFEWRRTRLVWWMWNGSLLSFSPTSLIQPKWETNCILFAANHQ